MTWNVNSQELAAVTELDNPSSYEYFIKHIADHEEVWSLKNASGWVLAHDGEHEAIPVWPHPNYAQLCATHEWADTSPAAIPLEEWMEKWLPGIIRDGRSIAVFPTPRLKGFIVEPARLNNDLEQYLDDWY